MTSIADRGADIADSEPLRSASQSGGVDAPEGDRSKCGAELRAENRATRRLQSLMSSRYSVAGGSTDKHRRSVVMVTLADWRHAGQVLIDKELPQP